MSTALLELTLQEATRPPCYGASIWFEQLVWYHRFLSVLVLVQLLTGHRRKHDLQAMCSNANTATTKKVKETIFQRKLQLIMTFQHDMPFEGFVQNLLHCFALCGQQQSLPFF